jgi:hypothetical protein
MKLYHGSNTVIETIDFKKCRPYKDFGRGFYLTEIEEQATLKARRTASIYGGTAVVTAFEFNKTVALSDSKLMVRCFDEPNEEWALFVMNNRSRTNVHSFHEYDIVIGPVADDTIAMLFRNFDDGIIDLPTLVNSLKFKRISSQYFFHSLKSAAYLKAL